MISLRDVFLEEREYQGESDISQREQDLIDQYLRSEASDDRLVYIDSLLHTCTLEPYQIEAIEREMIGLDNNRANEIIFMLKMNQQVSVKDFLRRIQKSALK